MPQINITLDVFAAVVTALLLLNCLSDKANNGQQKRAFIGMLSTLLVILVTDAYDWAANGNAGAVGMLYISNSVNYTAGYVIIIFFDRYLAGFVTDRRGWLQPLIRAFDVLCVLSALLVLINVKAGFFFTIDAEGVYNREGLYWLSQAFPAIALLVNAGIIAAWPGLKLRERLVFGTYPFFPFVGILADFVLHGWALTYVGAFLSVFLIYTQIYIQRGKKLLRQANELQEANIATMLSQIQPHFLYNALGSVEYLCRHDPELAQKTLREFELFLRGNMESLSIRTPIPFEKELDHLKHYLAIELLRFPEKLRVEYDLEVTNFRLPALSLQPIVENAVKHGLTTGGSGGGTVRISTRRSEGWNVITVEDDGAGFDTKAILQDDGRSHIGIKNVRERLRTMCSGSMDIESEPGKGTRVTMRIPVHGKAGPYEA